MGRFDYMRTVFEKADQYFKLKEESKEERKMLLDKWLEVEKKLGDDKCVARVEAKMPKLVKKQKRIWIENQEGEEEDGGWEEYVDYIYPDDPLNFREPKLLRKAHEWSKKLMQKAQEGAVNT